MADDELVFRGVKGRTLDDQVRAIEDGYASVAEMAIDELGFMVVALERRIAHLEQHTFAATPEPRGSYEDSRP